MRRPLWALGLVTVGLLSGAVAGAPTGAVPGGVVAMPGVELAAATAPASTRAPAGFTPLSVTFVSASRGWVLGGAPCGAERCAVIMRTTDGGRHWHRVPAPKAFPAAYTDGDGVNWLRFADARNGFAYGNLLYATHDGGASWHRVPIAGGAWDLATDGGFVYAASRNRDWTVSIYRSPVGQDRWSRVKGLPALDVQTWNPPPPRIVMHDRSVWVVAGNVLYASRDGSHWTHRRLPCPDRVEISLAAYDTRRLSLLCVGDFAMGSAGKAVFTSTNGGRTFVRRGNAPLGGIIGIAAQPTRSRVVVASSSMAAYVYLSDNGGRTWRTTWQVNNPGMGLRDFGFTTSRQGVLVVGLVRGNDQTFGLFMTRNGGVTWSRVTF